MKYNFVEGFLFTRNRDAVALIHKERGPNIVINKWNGIGGKIEDGEDPRDAMTREFMEEAGPVIGPSLWRNFAVLHGSEWTCHFYEFNSDWCNNVRTMTDEEVKVFPVWALPKNLVPNLDWLIPMALDPTIRDVAHISVL